MAEVRLKSLELNSHFGLTARTVVVVVLLLSRLRDIVQLFHGLRAAGGKRLSLGGGLAFGQRVVHCSSAAVVRGTGMRVHFGHLVAVQERRGRHEHVRVRYGSGHGFVTVKAATFG